MVTTIKMKNGDIHRIPRVIYCGVLSGRKDALYVQTKVNGKTKEQFIQLREIEIFDIREPRHGCC
jgi:hypothetical protein